MTAPTFNRTQLHNKVTAHGVLLVSNDFPFVNPLTAGKDCNVAVTSECVELVKGVKLTSIQVRDLGGDHIGGTGTGMTARTFLSQGMVEGVDWWRFYRQDIQVARDHLIAGHFVGLYVDYGVVNDLMGGKYAGSTYRGAHAIGLCGWWRANGKRMTWDYDPLFDGRDRPRALPDAPFGRQKAPFAVLRKAGEGYSGAGLLSGYAVKFA
jgi:hypothetical protein